MKITIHETEVLSKRHYQLNRYGYEMPNHHGTLQVHHREVFERGNGATIFLFDPTEKKVLLTKQFRLPTYLNGNEDGFLIECCAGVVEKNEAPESSIIREAFEEVGVKIESAEKVFEAYMSPGAVTELIHFFVSPYSRDHRISTGGGLESEQENIEVIEVSFKEARELFDSGKIKDGKTMMLFQYAILKGLI